MILSSCSNSPLSLTRNNQNQAHYFLSKCLSLKDDSFEVQYSKWELSFTYYQKKKKCWTDYRVSNGLINLCSGDLQHWLCKWCLWRKCRCFLCCCCNWRIVGRRLHTAQIMGTCVREQSRGTTCNVKEVDFCLYKLHKGHSRSILEVITIRVNHYMRQVGQEQYGTES